MSFDYKSAHSLEGKKVIVTGAGGNLGAEICRGLTAMGASVLATDVAVEKGQAIVEELTAAGATAHFLEHDVTDEAQWEAAVAAAIEKLGGLNGVINNAAIVPMNYLAELEVEEYNRVLNVNVTGSMLGCKHGFRAMQPGGPAGKGGSIINMSSVMGLAGTIALASYNSSKGAVRLLTKSVAAECAMLKTGIRCNSIHPGIVESEMGSLFHKQLVGLGVVPDMETSEAGFLAGVPMGEAASVSDIASGAVYLISDASRYVTGTELIIDGGFYAT